MKTKFETIQSKVETIASERSAWARGVKDYALELLENLESNPSLINEFNDGMPIRERDLLSGASDWLSIVTGVALAFITKTLPKDFARLAS